MRLAGLVKMQGVSRRMLAVTGVVSTAAVVLAVVQRWPGWAIAAAAVLPLFLPIGVQTRWLRQHYGWFAFFYLLVITQTGHYIEHVTQFVQDHVLHRVDAMGFIGVLDIEWVHFGWNTAVFLAVAVLVMRFRRNPWLWATLAIAVWHQVEHSYVIYRYATTGIAPIGFLPMGGLLFDGRLPIMGPDVHHIYNTIETLPLIAGFVYQLRRTHDSWLERAFPTLGPQALARATRSARIRRFVPGEVLVQEGEATDASFVVVRGEVGVLRSEGAGEMPAIVGPGQYFGETVLLDAAHRTATVRARTAGELVELDAPTFREILEESPETAETMRQLALQRSIGS